MQLRRDVARLTAEGATATDRERDLRQQLDRAQSAIQSATAPAFTTLLLSPGLVRESGSVARAQLAVGATSLRLILSVPGAVRPAYRVRVETAEGTGVWIDDHPRPVPATSGTAIETVVPIDRLKPGDYVVVVEGVADYAFRIPSPR